jgi:hypothetical protein
MFVRLVRTLIVSKSWMFIINFVDVQSTAHQILHFGLLTLISRALALILNCKCMAKRAVARTISL